jgi:hypothetical protein
MADNAMLLEAGSGRPRLGGKRGDGGGKWHERLAALFPEADVSKSALVACCASSSEVVAFVYAPLLLIRVIALPRVREHAITAGWLLGPVPRVPVTSGLSWQSSRPAHDHVNLAANRLRNSHDHGKYLR